GTAGGRRTDRDRRAEALGARAGGAERLLEAPERADPGAVQLLPGCPRRGFRLPVGDVPADGVPARRQVGVHAGAAPGRAPRARRAGEGAARAEPVRRGAAPPRAPGAPRPGRGAAPRRLAALRAVPAGGGRLDGRLLG